MGRLKPEHEGKRPEGWRLKLHSENKDNLQLLPESLATHAMYVENISLGQNIVRILSFHRYLCFVMRRIEQPVWSETDS